jgi:hypothetical protein
MSSSPMTVPIDAARAELEATLSSSAFARTRNLSNLLRYLCEKQLNGEADQLKEYTIAVEAYGRPSDFRQKENSIVRVEIKRLREKLRQYYESEGADREVQISIPVGQYAPLFGPRSDPAKPAQIAQSEQEEETPSDGLIIPNPTQRRSFVPERALWVGAGVAILIIGSLIAFRYFRSSRSTPAAVAGAVAPTAFTETSPAPPTDEIRILAGERPAKYVDHAGRIWTGDRLFTGGFPFKTFHPIIYRTLETQIYQAGRQGDFRYDIPLKPGVYELRLHFAETIYGPEEQQGGGETSRLFAIMANDQPLLRPLDIFSEAEGGRTAETKVFKDIRPAADGMLHLRFYSWTHSKSLVNAIEILPSQPGAIRPIRFSAHDKSIFTNDGRDWAPDSYFKGGRLLPRPGNLIGAKDPTLYEGERFGHFSYAIPVPPGRYTLNLYFAERFFGSANSPDKGVGSRVFDILCNGQALLKNFDIFKESGGHDRALIRKFPGLTPNSQGKLLIQFNPVANYALVNAVEVIDEAWKNE